MKLAKKFVFLFVSNLYFHFVVVSNISPFWCFIFETLFVLLFAFIWIKIEEGIAAFFRLLLLKYDQQQSNR